MNKRILVSTMIAVAALRVSAQTFLIDFGNDGSFRGTNVPNPDINGNYWNSVNSTSYWPNLVDINSNVTTVGFGFTTALGTDSFNGPAGTNSDPALVEIDAAALGDLGVNEAVFDWYSTSTFTVQGLDPSKTYNIIFFGSRKFTADTTTVYTVYTSNDYATAVASVSLDVNEPGFPWLHNSNRVAIITNVSPQFADSLWIGYQGDRGNSGYLNAFKIEEYQPAPPPANEIPFSRIFFNTGEIGIGFVGENNIGYSLEFSTNVMHAASWQTVLDGGNPVSATGDGVNELLLFDNSLQDPSRIYRLIRSP